jgi:NDP-sugar pyrophosphorylase family protein
MQAIILAGGKGRRLLPYTTVLPKPMMPIGDFPILEVVIRQLIRDGFDDIIISTGYLDAIIKAYIASQDFGAIHIRFSTETTPLGTMGPLHLIDELDECFLVINGDILTDLRFSLLYSLHQESKAVATIATYRRDVYIDFGVIKSNDENKIVNFIEKPIYHFDVSMGIYLLNREILTYIPKNQGFGFDQLMHVLIENNANMVRFLHNGFWLDVGRPDDYEQAIVEFEQDSNRFLT